jgi:hypothetical protein
MKIQINSLEALERLIGGDTEVELEIRNNIVQEFAKKNLKALVNEGTITAVATEIENKLKRDASSIITAKFGNLSGDYWNRNFILSRECTAALNNAAEDAFRTRISSTWSEIERRLIERYSEEYIQTQISRSVDSEVNTRIEEGVRTRLEAIKNSI